MKLNAISWKFIVKIRFKKEKSFENSNKANRKCENFVFQNYFPEIINFQVSKANASTSKNEFYVFDVISIEKYSLTLIKTIFFFWNLICVERNIHVPITNQLVSVYTIKK